MFEQKIWSNYLTMWPLNGVLPLSLDALYVNAIFPSVRLD
jgi:hypothetical protein